MNNVSVVAKANSAMCARRMVKQWVATIASLTILKIVSVKDNEYLFTNALSMWGNYRYG
jgi:hypothetical protein